MFKELSEKLDSVFKKLRGQGKLSEKNIADAMREVRRALLEADVNFKVVKTFIEKVQAKAVGTEVLESIAPGQQVVKIVHDELISLLGDSDRELELKGNIPHKIMLVGLQGSGKTTTAGKLALLLRSRNKKMLLVAADVHRPAAVDQLKIIGKSLDIPVYSEETKDAPALCANALRYAEERFYDLCIFDTAGRQHVDEDMMKEAIEIRNRISPNEILFVADSMTGQDAVNAANSFNEKLNFTGVILTKIDGDARGGAALSIRSVTGKPIKFIGVSEKMDGLEVFHPDRMASRILGMGDIVSLVEKAQATIDLEKSQELEEKIRKNQLTLEDFLSQLKEIKKMGPIQDIMAMIPGMNKMPVGDVDEKSLSRTEAIVSSMTREERRKPLILNGSRRKRIAKGSGTTVMDVNRLLKQFEQMQKMFKMMNKSGGKMSRIMSNLGF